MTNRELKEAVNYLDGRITKGIVLLGIILVVEGAGGLILLVTIANTLSHIAKH